MNLTKVINGRPRANGALISIRMQRRKHRLMISVDGIRKDRLACYNSKAALITPNIDRISKECVRFDDMLASSTSTAQCFASIFSGRNSREFGRSKYGDSVTPFEDNVFSDHEEKGYKSVVCVNRRIRSWINQINTWSNAEFWWTGSEVAGKSAADKDAASYRPGEQVDYFIERADKEVKPLCAWLHLVGWSSAAEKHLERYPFEYDARVAELDEAVGRFFDHFKETAEIFIFSDHGYAFFEQSRWAYGKDGHSLVEPVVTVPYLVYNGVDKGVNSDLVSQIRNREIVGDSHKALNVSDDIAICESRYEEQHDLALAIRKGAFKLAYYFSTGTHQFYDLANDPLENIDYACGEFHKVARDEMGSHPDVNPFILRADWDLLTRTEEEMLDMAKSYYGPKVLERHRRNRSGINAFASIRACKQFVGKMLGEDKMGVRTLIRSMLGRVRPRSSGSTTDMAFTKEAPFDERFKKLLSPLEARKLHAIGLEPQDIIEVPLEKLYLQFRSEWHWNKLTDHPRRREGLRVIDSPLVTFLQRYAEEGEHLFISGGFRDTDYYRVWQASDKVGWRYNWYDYPAKFEKRYTDASIESKMRSVAAVYESIRDIGYQKGRYSNTTVTAIIEPFETTRFGYEHHIDGYEVWGGHHRIAALHVLGFKETDIMVLKDINPLTAQKAETVAK